MYRNIGAMLVFDITSLKSFNDLKKWYIEVQRITDNKCVYQLVGNFAETKDEFREVPKSLAKSWANENGFGY